MRILFAPVCRCQERCSLLATWIGPTVAFALPNAYQRLDGIWPPMHFEIDERWEADRADGAGPWGGDARIFVWRVLTNQY